MAVRHTQQLRNLQNSLLYFFIIKYFFFCSLTNIGANCRSKMKTQAHVRLFSPNCHSPFACVGASAFARPQELNGHAHSHFFTFTRITSQHLRTITIFARRMSMMMYQIVVVLKLQQIVVSSSGWFWRWNRRSHSSRLLLCWT